MSIKPRLQTRAWGHVRVGRANTLMIEETYGHLNPEYRREQMEMLKVV